MVDDEAGDAHLGHIWTASAKRRMHTDCR